jgi:TolB-like protein/cytochrome c-type biogenesis protein CcmH/NrfG
VNLSGWVQELQRRRVFRALGGYGIAAFAILQVVEPIMHGLHLGDWVLTAVVVALGLGFPVAVALAWVYDLTAHGIERTDDPAAPGAPADPTAASPASATPRGPRLALALGAIGLLAAAPGVILHLTYGRGRAAPAAEPLSEAARSVAVLPFTNLSPDPDNAYFADGVHAEIITQLARISGLRVIARSSVQQYRDGARDLPAIAAALGVGSFLEGTVQRAGHRVRIAAQLVEGQSRRELWAETYDRDLEDTFAIQTDVALDIARTLGARLSPAEKREVERPPTADREAHDLYLRGVDAWERSMGVESDNRAAEALLQQAIARDPSFAAAHAKLAQVAAEWNRDCLIARHATERALALQPDGAEAQAALGHLRYYCERDTAGGVKAYEAAARSAPGDAQVRTYLGFLRLDAGQVDAGLADLGRARDLDPRSYPVGIYYALALASVRRFDEAGQACQRALALQPGDAFATLLAGLIPFWRDGDLGAPARALDALPREWPTGGAGARFLLEILALLPERTLALAGAGRLPDPLSQPPLVPRAFAVARAHAALGQADQARAAFATTRAALEATVKAQPQEPEPRVLLARAYAGLGWGDDAVRELGVAGDLLRAQGLAGSALLPRMAEVYLASGRRDLALGALRHALEGRDGFVTLASIRADPRFASLRADLPTQAGVAPGAAAP